MQPLKSPLISVIVLNYNGNDWLIRCLNSIKEQTLADRLEILIPDNDSTDGSAALAETWADHEPNATFVQNGANLGYCEGNNRAAQLACGKYLFFVNNDTWMEQECLELLLRETEKASAHAATPQVLDYDNDQFQSIGSPGFDIFGLSGTMRPVTKTTEIFAACGCSLLVRRNLFHDVGGFDEKFFMYADETDLGWRICIAGGRVVAVPKARLHHRRHITTNTASPSSNSLSFDAQKRYLANRNGLLFILKNAQHFLIMLSVSYLALMAVEGLVSLCVVKQRSFFRHAYVQALQDVWKLRLHIVQQRKFINEFRVRGDYWMFRFLQWRPSRWEDWCRLCDELVLRRKTS